MLVPVAVGPVLDRRLSASPPVVFCLLTSTVCVIVATCRGLIEAYILRLLM